MTKIRIPIPVIVGATGTGKTALALELARRLGADVISADSRQVYRDFRIGTATPAGVWKNSSGHPVGRFYEVGGVPHHLMDFLDPTEDYNAGRFAADAGTILERALKSRRAILAGGTGLYLRALIDGLAPLPGRNEELRRKLGDLAEKRGRDTLHQDLRAVDPVAAAAIPPNNLQRVIRALEVHALTGRPLSELQKAETKPSGLPYKWFGLRWPKELLEKRIRERCQKMVGDGLLEETESLLKRGVPPDAPAFQALGYRLAMDRLAGRIPSRTFEQEFIRQTLLYVKRQSTWFRANKRVQWFDLDENPRFSLLAHRIEEDLTA